MLVFYSDFKKSNTLKKIRLGLGLYISDKFTHCLCSKTETLYSLRKEGLVQHHKFKF